MLKSIKHFLFFAFLLYPLTNIISQPAIIIDVTQTWTDTGIQMSDSSAVIIYSQGYATWSNFGQNSDLSFWVTPVGIGGNNIAVNSNYPCQDCPAFSLIAKVGPGGTPRYIGPYGILGTEVGGELYLGINDEITDDNYGRFIALVFPWEGVPSSVVENVPQNHSFKLDQNYPNPFNPSTTINYSIQESGNVIIKIYDSLGKQIRILVNETKNSGEYRTIWDGRDDNGKKVSSGVYFYQIQVGDYIQAKKMIMLR